VIASRALHASDLALYRRCEYRFKLANESETRPSFRHPAALIGTAIHRTIESLHANVAGIATPEDLRAQIELYFQDEIDHGQDSDIPVLWPLNGDAAKKRQSLLDDAFEMIAGYWIDPRNSEAKLAGLEVEWDCELLGRPFQGRIDQVRVLEDATLQILDLKSGAERPGETFLTLWPQAHVYALAAARGALFEGRKVSKVTWVHLRDYIPYKINRPAQGIVKGERRGPAFYDVPITERSIASMEQELAGFISALDSDRFPRRPSNHNCSSCPYAAVCLSDFIGGPVPDTKMEVTDEDFE
jgi:RecB family exonuclease